jgi:hypothetical protein
MRKQPAVEDAPAASKLQSSCGSPHSSSLLTVATYSSTGHEGSDVESRLQRHHNSRPCSKTDGWVVAHSITCPSIVIEKDSSVHFGECLVPGSDDRQCMLQV